MKNKSMLLTLVIFGTILLVMTLFIAYGNQNQERMSMKETNSMMAEMMGNSRDEIPDVGMMGMMQGMMNSEEMKKMHKEMIAEMKEYVDEFKEDEKQELQEMINHMGSCQ